MKNKKIILAIFASITLLGQAQAQKLTTNTNKATAKLVASCQIAAQSVSFGNIILPLTTQSANSNLSVLCNKGANYSIEMTYGGIYGKSYPGSTVYRLAGEACAPTITRFNVFDVLTGVKKGQSCGLPEKFVTQNWEYYTGEPVNFNYGKMVGASKGDNVAYSLEVPGKTGVVWNTSNKYSATGTGETESIPVKATLVPSQSGSAYPIPDMYLDTVTAQVTF